MKQRPWARLAAAVGGGVGLALMAPVLAAIGQISPPAPVLEIGPTARLVAQGAAVAVPVRVVVTCQEGGDASVNMQVAQAVGPQVAHAFGSVNQIPCNGTPQSVEVFATSSDLTFRPGPAFATANLFCGFSGPPPFGGCSAQAQREIFIVGDFGPPPTGPPPTILPPPTFPPPPTTIPGLPNFGSFIEAIFRALGLPFGFGL